MIRRLLPALLAAGLLSGCLPAGGSGAGAPAGAPQPVRASAAGGDRLSALDQEFASVAPQNQKLEWHLTVERPGPRTTILPSSLSSRALRGGDAADLTLQVDVSQGAPLYRVIVSNADFGPEAFPSNGPDLEVGFKMDDTRYAFFYVPDVARTWKGDGLYVSDWLACDACLPNRSVTSREESYRRVQATTIDHVRAAASGRARVTPALVRLVSMPEIVAKSIVAGRANSELAASRTSSQLDGERAARQAGKAHEPEYRAFRKEIAPLTLAGHIERLGCLEQMRTTTSGGTREWREILHHNDRFIDCRIEAIETYDHAGFAARFEAIAAREKALAEKAYGVEQPPLYTPEGQVKAVVKEIRQAEAANEHAAYAVDYYRKERAQRERENQRLRAAMLDFQRSINAAQAQVRDMAPVVRADGTVSTVGAERRRAASGAWPTSGRRSGRGSGAGRRPGDRPSGGGRRASSGGDSDRGYSLFVSTEYGTGKIAERCDPLGVMGQHTARCRVIEVVRHYRVHHAKCTVYDGGSVMPAEVVRQNTHLIVSLDGLTAADQSRIEAEAAKVGRPYAVSNSPNVVRNLVREDYAGFGTAAPGVRTYYASEWDMKRDLKARGCVSYELDGTLHALN